MSGTRKTDDNEVDRCASQELSSGSTFSFAQRWLCGACGYVKAWRK